MHIYQLELVTIKFLVCVLRAHISTLLKLRQPVQLTCSGNLWITVSREGVARYACCHPTLSSSSTPLHIKVCTLLQSTGCVIQANKFWFARKHQTLTTFQGSNPESTLLVPASNVN